MWDIIKQGPYSRTELLAIKDGTLLIRSSLAPSQTMKQNHFSNILLCSHRLCLLQMFLRDRNTHVQTQIHLTRRRNLLRWIWWCMKRTFAPTLAKKSSNHSLIPAIGLILLAFAGNTDVLSNKLKATTRTRLRAFLVLNISTSFSSLRRRQ